MLFKPSDLPSPSFGGARVKVMAPAFSPFQSFSPARETLEAGKAQIWMEAPFLAELWGARKKRGRRTVDAGMGKERKEEKGRGCLKALSLSRPKEEAWRAVEAVAKKDMGQLSGGWKELPFMSFPFLAMPLVQNPANRRWHWTGGEISVPRD
jgi:hypothetical protein